MLTEVANWLTRDDLTADIPGFVQNAENKLYRTLNLRNEETALDEAISGGLATVPADFKKLKFAYYDGSPIVLVDWTPIEDLYRDYPDRSDSTTCPDVISREVNSFIFGPAVTDGTLKGVYYAKQDFARDTDPSWYVSNAPEVLLYGSLLEAEPFIKDDPRIPIWKEFFRESIQTLVDENENAEVSMGQLRQVAS